MMNPKEKQVIRERAERLIRQMLDELATGDADIIRDLLTEIDVVEADNAELLGAIIRPISRLDDDPHDLHECVNCHQEANAKYNLVHEPGCLAAAEHPGTALLARHAEELAAKDAEIDSLRRVNAGLVEGGLGAEKELERVRTALREVVLECVDSARSIWRCNLCEDAWERGTRFGEVENHQPVTINGVPGECPAKLPEDAIQTAKTTT